MIYSRQSARRSILQPAAGARRSKAFYSLLQIGHLLRLMSRFVWGALLFFALLPAHADAPPTGELRKSLVRITNTAQEPNYRVPWNPGDLGGGMGSGMVIDGARVLTNAHVVSNARFLSVERENDPKRYIAKVDHIAHDCDLAVLKVEDPKFFDGTVALQFGGIPEVDSTVSVYGYPIGGERLSVTRGVVSRVDFQNYSHSGVDAHLALQIDAAINPGNSGGPVLQDGKVVGVAFQGYRGDQANSTGYMIPVPVIQRFLRDIEDGRYDRYMDLSVSWFPLLNPSHREALGLPSDDRGVVVSSVASAGASANILKPGDVLLSIDGHPIFSDAFVELEGARVQMAEIVERKFKGETVKLEIMRDRQRQEVIIPLNEPWPFGMQANQYEVLPRYVLFAGLLFQPMNRDFMDAYDVEDLQLRYFFDFFVTDEIYREHPEIVVLSAILPDPINTYSNEFRSGILDEVNGQKIKTLDDLAAAVAAPAEQYVFKFLGEGRPLVLERAAIDAARERIVKRYRVTREQNLEEKMQ
jgi:S1-C subfamily serine protease